MPNPTPEGTGMTVTETSTDGMVRVSVDAQGVPTELTLTSRAWGADPARLSAELMTCLRRAQGTVAAQVQDLVIASVPGRADSGGRSARHARRSSPPEDDLGEIRR